MFGPTRDLSRNLAIICLLVTASEAQGGDTGSRALDWFKEARVFAEKNREKPCPPPIPPFLAPEGHFNEREAERYLHEYHKSLSAAPEDRVPCPPSPPPIPPFYMPEEHSLSYVESEAARRALEDFRNGLEEFREQLERGREKRYIDIDSYREGLPYYYEGIFMYRDGIEEYRSTVEDEPQAKQID